MPCCFFRRSELLAVREILDPYHIRVCIVVRCHPLGEARGRKIGLKSSCFAVNKYNIDSEGVDPHSVGGKYAAWDLCVVSQGIVCIGLWWHICLLHFSADSTVKCRDYIPNVSACILFRAFTCRLLIDDCQQVPLKMV